MRSRPMWWMVCLALVAAALPHPARAQGTSASIQGSVIDDTGPLPGATIVAKDTQSGFQHDAVTAVDGTFTLSGLRPGTYEITVTMPQFKPQSKTLQVQVGQSVTANFKITPDVLYTEQVQVVGNSRLVETRTSRDRDDCDDRGSALPAAEPAQLPQLRGARARRAGVERRDAQAGDRRRPRRDADQRLHRRRQLQERRPRRRRRRAGLEPGLAVPADARSRNSRS